MHTTIDLSRQSPVTTITLRRPECRNAVDGPIALALHEAFEVVETDASAHVAVLHGGGGYFCGGADLRALGDATKSNVLTPDGSGAGPMGS